MNELTEAVEEYKKTKDSKSFVKVQRLSRGLTENILKIYKINYFPKLEIEEIRDNCNSVILIKAINTFNSERANFSTHFVWKLKSHVNCERKKLLRRKNILNAIQIHDLLTAVHDDAKLRYSEIINKINKVLYNRKSKCMCEIFGI